MRITFTKLQLDACQDLSAREGNPAYLRLYHLALLKAKPNGHAEFGRGDLANLLGKGKKRYRSVDSAIAQAIGYGLLDPFSESECLVLPDGLIDPYDHDAAGFECATHGGTPRPRRFADCHPDRPHYSFDMCEPCYRKRRRLTASTHVEAVADDKVSDSLQRR